MVLIFQIVDQKKAHFRNRYRRAHNSPAQCRVLVYLTMSWNYASYIKYPDRNYRPGHQKLDKDQVEEIVTRLNVNKVYEHDNATSNVDSKRLTAEQVEKLLERIADKDINMAKTPDRQRTGADNYFNAWKANDILGYRM